MNRATKAVVRSCSSKKVFLKISQYSKENTCEFLQILRIISEQNYKIINHYQYKSATTETHI